jgi:MFS transporter, PAT family, beta-lactamase induction signal transducer AmpG
LIMYAATAFELGSAGLGSGAFGVLLLRLTQKRFSATQYALLSSLFTLPRVLAGPVAGVMADAIGWRDFFIFTIVTGIPGMVMLARFVPWGVRDPVFQVAASRTGPPLSKRAIALRASVGALAAWTASLLVVGSLGGLATVRGGAGFDPGPATLAVLRPITLGEWMTSLGLVVLALAAGLATAAVLAARQSGPSDHPRPE